MEEGGSSDPMPMSAKKYSVLSRHEERATTPELSNANDYGVHLLVPFMHVLVYVGVRFTPTPGEPSHAPSVAHFSAFWLFSLDSHCLLLCRGLCGVVRIVCDDHRILPQRLESRVICRKAVVPLEGSAPLLLPSANSDHKNELTAAHFPTSHPYWAY